MKGLVISCAGFAPAVLNAYGGSWVSTPALDRLAASALVFDRFTAESLQTSETLRSVWTGSHALAVARSPSWIPSLRDRGIPATLVTDDAEVAAAAREHGFSHVEQVDMPLREQPAESLAETAVVRLVHAATLHAKTGGLLWIHYGGLENRWDAPLEQRQRWADEEEVEPFGGVIPGSHDSAEDADEDAFLSWLYAYVAQMAVMDGAFAPLLDAATGDSWSHLAILGTCGMALNEHGAYGPGAGPLRWPRLHLPLMLRTPETAPVRSSLLCQPRHLAATLAAWFQDEPDPAGDPRRLDRQSHPEIWVQDLEDRPQWAEDPQLGISLLSQQWHWCRTGEAPPALYLKPDDRYDMNDVSERATDVVADWAQQAPALRAAVVAGTAR